MSAHVCSVCEDSTPCERNGMLAKQAMGAPPKCALERSEPGAGFVYGVLLRLAAKLDVDIAELMRP